MTLEPPPQTKKEQTPTNPHKSIKKAETIMNQHEKRMLLTSVSRPGRYAGGEYGQIIKDKAAVKARFAFAFPDSYEIGMSNLGVRTL